MKKSARICTGAPTKIKILFPLESDTLSIKLAVELSCVLD
jgi:hypothetical protein